MPDTYSTVNEQPVTDVLRRRMAELEKLSGDQRHPLADDIQIVMLCELQSAQERDMVMRKLIKIEGVVEATLAQAQETNGRLLKAEENIKEFDEQCEKCQVRIDDTEDRLDRWIQRGKDAAWLLGKMVAGIGIVAGVFWALYSSGVISINLQ